MGSLFMMGIAQEMPEQNIILTRFKPLVKSSGGGYHITVLVVSGNIFIKTKLAQ